MVQHGVLIAHCSPCLPAGITDPRSKTVGGRLRSCRSVRSSQKLPLFGVSFGIQCQLYGATDMSYCYEQGQALVNQLQLAPRWAHTVAEVVRMSLPSLARAALPVLAKNLALCSWCTLAFWSGPGTISSSTGPSSTVWVYGLGLMV